MDGLLLVDKPVGITSHDGVDQIRRRLKIRRVGHAGTLDPAASGLLILLIGKATRQARELLLWDKSYLATLRLGITTDTQDAEGLILEQKEIPSFTLDQIEQTLAAFQGWIEQVIPAYSAVRVNGKHFYELARQGIPVPRRVRQVKIEELKILGVHLPDVELAITCSKGTYIRALCAAIGEALGCGGHLAALRRTRVGPYTIEQAVPLEEARPEHVIASPQPVISSPNPVISSPEGAKQSPASVRLLRRPPSAASSQ